MKCNNGTQINGKKMERSVLIASTSMPTHLDIYIFVHTYVAL